VKRCVAMSFYVPLMSKIVESSLWDEPDLVVKVFLTMLVKKDRDNVVRANAYNIARWARKTEAEVLEALAVLAAPDTKRLEPQLFDGRRIEKVEDGWKILNGEFYQKMMIQENTRTRVARAQAAFRERNREAMESSTGNNSTKHDLWVDACKVYDFYPRKVGKQAAVRKIAAGIGEFGLEKVLEATKLYAKAWEGAMDLKFCPHPATWFGQHRFNDDPATWVRNEGKKLPESREIHEEIEIPKL